MAQAAQIHVDDLDDVDAKILDELQNRFPVEPRPYDVLAARLDLDVDEVLRRTQKYLDGQVIRQLSAIFDTKGLGYQSSLVAARYPAERLDEAAEIINQHPGVSHNYARNHEFNLWFTVAIPPESKLGLEGTIEALEKESGAEKMRILPTLKLFKIGVDLDVSGKRSHTARSKAVFAEKDRSRTTETSDEERAVIREAQKPMPVVREPWAQLAEQAGTTRERFLEVLGELKGKGQMRRVAAVLFHRKMGFRANGMGVWKVPEDRIDEVGPQMGSYRNVSHCYLRPTYADWPYNLFTMVHARSMDECEEILDAISEETGIEERTSLYSTKEYKKTRVPYFTAEMDEWESARA